MDLSCLDKGSVEQMKIQEHVRSQEKYHIILSTETCVQKGTCHASKAEEVCPLDTSKCDKATLADDNTGTRIYASFYN